MGNVTLKKIINAYGMVLILILLFLGLSVSIDGFFSTKTMWSIIEQVSMFGIIAIIGYETDSLDVLHADNSGHTFLEILDNQLQALAIVFDNVAGKAFIQKDNVDTRLFSQS